TPLERHPERRSPYTLAKLEQENLVRARAMADGWHWAIVRPGLVYGPDRAWFHHLGIQLSATRWIGLERQGLLPLCHVTSCADAIGRARETDSASGQTFNLVDSDLPTREHYLAMLAERGNARTSVHFLSWKALDRLARGLDWINRRLLLGRAPMPGLFVPA